MERDKNGRFIGSLLNRVKKYLKDLPWENFTMNDGVIRRSDYPTYCPLMVKTGLTSGYSDKAAQDLKTSYAKVVALVWEAADERYPRTNDATNLRQWMIQQINGAKRA